MERVRLDPRPDWRGDIAKLGLAWHTPAGTPTWHEDTYYLFSQAEIESLVEAGETVHQLYLNVVKKTRNYKYWPLIDGISTAMAEKIVTDWDADVPTVCGRMDFCYDGTAEPRLISYCADSPSGLVETAILQKNFQEARFPTLRQCNRLQEQLTDRWAELIVGQQDDSLHVTAERHRPQDIEAAQFMGMCAANAGFRVKYYPYNDTGVDEGTGLFYDTDNTQIVRVYHHYPWEAYAKEDYFQFVEPTKCQWIEPAWKMALTNKGLLPRLWEDYPFHENLLQSATDHDGMRARYVRKPVWGRDGIGVQVYDDGKIIAENRGAPDDVGYIYQEYGECREFDGYRPVVSAWIVLSNVVAISIREETGLITHSSSRTVPHIIG